MSTLAIDVHQLIRQRLNDAPLEDLLKLVSQPAAPMAVDIAECPAAGLLLPNFVKIGATGLELPFGANDWVATKDRSTGVIYSRDTIGAGCTWSEAKDRAAAVDLCGWKDWRLPTRRELLSLVDDTRHSPAINTDFFDCKSDFYWTDTPLASSPGVGAWGVNFGNGDANWLHRDYGSGLVRAVRASQ